MIEVEGPDGTIIEFPDGTPDSVINAEMAKAYPAPKPAPAPPPELRANQGLGVGLGIADILQNVTNRINKPINTAIRAVGGPDETFPENAWGQAVERREAEAALAGEKPGGVGRAVGQIAATIPATAVTKNPFLGGAIGGAAASKSESALGFAGDTLVGGAGGKVGDTAVRALGSVINPIFRPAVQRMLERKVPMTPGQIIGGTAQKVEDAVSDVPFIGDIIRGAQDRGTDAFNRSMNDEVLGHIGQKLPKDVRTGQDAIRHTQEALEKAYTDILPTVPLQADHQFVNNLANIRTIAQQLPDDLAGSFDRTLQTEMRRHMTPQGKMTGEGFKRMEEELGRKVRNLRSHGASPHDRDLADAFAEVQAELRDLVARQNPQAAKRIKDINTAYAKMTRVERAAAGVPEGIYTGAQLRRSATTSKNSSIKQAARGDALTQQAAEDAHNVLGQKLGNSGTATRGAVTLGLGALATGALPSLNINPLFAAGVLGALMPYTRPGQALLNKSLLRPKGAAAARRQVEKARPAAAVTGGVLAPKPGGGKPSAPVRRVQPDGGVTIEFPNGSIYGPNGQIRGPRK